MSKYQFRMKGNIVNHYGYTKIQPIQWINQNDLDFNMGNVVKYLCRHQSKGQADTLNKVLDYYYWRIEIVQNWDDEETFKYLTLGQKKMLDVPLDLMTINEKWELNLLFDENQWEYTFLNLLFNYEYGCAWKISANYIDERYFYLHDKNKTFLEIYNIINSNSIQLYGRELKENLFYEYLKEKGLI